MANMI